MSLPPKTKPEIKHQNHFILRTPLLSLRHASAPPMKVERFEAGLLLASRAYWQQAQKYESLSPSEKTKLDRSKLKYWLRASTRPTPYGTFAGVALGNITEEPSKIILAKPEQHRVALRIDMLLLSKIIAKIQSDIAIREHLTYTLNNSLYHVPGGYRYAEWQSKDGARNYHLSEIAGSKTLDRILSVAKTPVSLSQLRAIIAEDSQSELEQIDSYIRELLDSQILISNLESTITGIDPLTELIHKLSSIKYASKFTKSLTKIQSLIQQKECSIEQIQCIETAIDQSKFVNDSELTFLQADTFLNCVDANLNESLVLKIIQQIQSLLILGQTSSIHHLDDFKKRFEERYEGQSVPLAIALDGDLGIGYGFAADHSAGNNPIIDDLVVIPAKGHRSITQTPLTELSVRKFEEWAKGGCKEIRLTEEDFSGFEHFDPMGKWPASMYLMGSLLGDNHGLDEDTFQFDVTSIGGPSAANLLGRFTYGDEAMLNFVRDILNEEAKSYPDSIHAEVAHCAQERIGNIQFRPLLRPFEIPYVGLSGAAKDQQISIEDLRLRLDGSELILWSQKHNKRVIPRLSTAHNYSTRSLPIYKFLCDLQRQNTLSLQVWNWGALDSARHLPRVVYQNLILKKARWIIEENDISNENIDDWRKEQNVPLRVLYTEGDNELLIDFSKNEGQKLFLQLIKKHKQLQLEEFLFTEENALVKNSNGEGLTNELIIPFSIKHVPFSKKKESLSVNDSVPRKFLPGSEWVYYKIYCGPKSAETILVKNLLPMIKSRLTAARFDCFFFIRYYDDAHHLRIRFRCPDITQRHELIDAFHESMEPLVNDGLVSKICQDTYTREIERYGSNTIVLTESLFHNDSIATLQFLELLNECSNDDYRLLFALRSTDMLLDDFELSISQKQKLSNLLQKAYFEEFGASPELQKSLNNRYREWQTRIASHMDEANDDANEILEAVSIYQQRGLQNKTIIKSIKAISDVHEWMNWLRSYIHMNLNRLFASEQRKHELLVYHFLEKYYSSQIAREARTKKMSLING